MNKYKKGDKVIITKGKDKGKTGNILTVFPEEKKIVVEKINIVKRHMKPSQQSKGGIIEMPAKLSWANAKLVCPKSDKPTRVGIKEIKGKRVRFAKVSGELLK
jgi:large subunit ribosomal protein L24